MGFGIELLLIVIMLLGGGGRDLLDLLPTDAYWQSKQVTVTLEQLDRDAGPDDKPEGIERLFNDLGSPEFKVRRQAKKSLEAIGAVALPQFQEAMKSSNPEVRAAAAELMKEFEGKTKARAVRRLMAIRTLGERHEREAVSLLQSLTGSKEMFVSEYAGRAMAQIENRPWTPADHSKEVQGDVQLLPRRMGIVAQTQGLGIEPLTLESFIDKAEAMEQAERGRGRANGFGFFPNIPPKPEFMQKGTAAILQLAERIGNVRFDGVTIGISDDASEETGYAILIFRGQYDPAAALSAAKSNITPSEYVKFYKQGDIDVIQSDVETTFMLPSEHQLMILLSDQDDVKVRRLRGLAAAAKTGRSSIQANTELMGLLKNVDTTSPLWIAGKLNEHEKRAPGLHAFDSFAIVGKMNKAKNVMVITGTGTGSDEADVKTSVDELSASARLGAAGLQPMAGEGSPLQPLVRMLESIQVKAEGKSATLTAELNGGVPSAIISAAGPLILMDLVPDLNTPPAPVRPVRPVPAAVPVPIPQN